jgi:hypothetical protein
MFSFSGNFEWAGASRVYFSIPLIDIRLYWIRLTGAELLEGAHHGMGLDAIDEDWDGSHTLSLHGADQISNVWLGRYYMLPATRSESQCTYVQLLQAMLSFLPEWSKNLNKQETRRFLDFLVCLLLCL